MSKSTLKLYKNFPFRDSENKVIESISSYLATLSTETINDFQFIKETGLNYSIKLDKAQSLIENLATNNWNYCSIQNADGKLRYFYVTDKTWSSSSSIKFMLKLDVMNSFTYGSDYLLTDETKVIREHKDRWGGGKFDDATRTMTSTCDHVAYINGVVWGYKDFTFIEYDPITRYEWIAFNQPQPEVLELEANRIVIRVYGDNANVGLGDTCSAIIKLYFGGYQRIIDPYSEGLNSDLIKENEEEINDYFGSNHWNLAIEADSDGTDLNDPVNVYLIPDKPVSVVLPSSVPEYTYADFTDNQIYLITGHTPLLSLDPAEWTEEKFIINDEEEITVTPDIANMINGFVHFNATWYYLKRTGTTLTLTKNVQYYSEFIGIPSGKNATQTTSSVISSIKIPESSSGLWIKEVAATTTDFRNIKDTQYRNGNRFPIPSWTTYEIAGIDSYDKEKPTVLKIINLPYTPFIINQHTADSILIPDGFEYESGKLKLNGKKESLIGNISSDVYTPVKELYGKDFTPTPTDLKNKQYESKLFHSDFYLPKVVYDSTSYAFKLETVDKDSINLISGIPNLTFKYVISTSGSDKSYFIFDSFKYNRSKEDYDKHMTTNRSNEIPIFTNNYLNYIRNGYNYDVKARDRAIGSNAFNTSLGVAKAGMQLANGGYVEGLLSGASAVVTSAMNYQAIQDNFNYKLDQLKMQSVSVSGSDDLPLFKTISNNHAKLVLYKVNSRLEDLLFNMFFKYGYLTQELKKPVINTRYWFNFLQCEADIDGINSNLSSVILEEIKTKLAEGVTFFHLQNGTYNLDQTKENWEVSIL